MEFLLFNKPYRVLSQFTDKRSDQDSEAPRATLADFIQQPGYYPAGRLDYLSEGLLILTDNGAFQNRISAPDNKMEKSYWVQVTGAPSDQALEQLSKGVILKDGLTLPAKVGRLDSTPTLWPREPAVALHRAQDSSWINIIIRQGKNRQVRRMLASVGHPVLRLIRHQIGPWKLDDINSGQTRVCRVNLPKNDSQRPNKAAKSQRPTNPKRRLN